MPLQIVESNGGVSFGIRVVPRASKSEIVGEVGGILRVRISAPPVDGAANEELMRLLSKAFGVAKSNVAILSGHTTKAKRIRIAGVTVRQARELAGE